MANTYLIGETVKITGTFTQNGEPSDPAIVRAIYKNPSASEVTTLTYPEDITKVADGVYSFEIIIDCAGYWNYRMDDGGVNIAVEDQFNVRLSDLLS